MLDSANPFFLAFVILANLLIGGYVYRRNQNAPANRAFGLMAAMAAVWTLAVILSHHSSVSVASCARILLASGSMLPLATLFFVELATERFESDAPNRARWFVLPTAIFFLLSFTPLVVRGATRDNGVFQITYGTLHPAYVAWALLVFTFATKWLIFAYRRSVGQSRLQAAYLLLAFMIPIVVGASTNLLIPLLFKSSSFGKFGPYVSLVMIAMIGHAIIRHRLMDIRVKVRRGVVYLAAVLIAGLALLMLLVVSNTFFHDEHQAPIREILLALLVAVLFAPLKGQIQRAFDRYLYREPYDYQRTIRETSRALSTTIDLPTLLGHFARTVGATLRPEGLAIYLRDEEEGRFERAHLLGHGQFPHSVAPTLPLLVELERERRLFFLDEVGRQPGGPEPAVMLDGFARLGSEVLAPLVDSDRVIGFLAVGAKRSGDPFFSDDADLLATLANQSAVAVRNAQVHHQVLLVNEHIQRILATIESGVVAVGARGRITLFNRAAEGLAGVSAQALLGQPVGHLPVPLARLLESTAADGESRSQIEIALPNSAGQLIPLMCSTSPLVGLQGTYLGAVAVFSDLSRLKELEQEKRRAERLASLEAIASGMVHEIRNPLVSLKAFTQLVPTRFDDAEFRTRLVRVADREITRIDGLLGRFRTLSSAHTQPMVPVDVTDPIQAALELLGPEFEARGISVRRVGPASVPTIPGNASQIEQLIHNLCLNSLEAMSEGGELTLRVADLREAGGNYLLIEISDTGPGVPPELIDKIFNPFITSKARGSGLGLAICSSIADAHRATLRVRNHTGRPGCTFTIEFPAPSERPATIPT
jgi:two-component system nitrogen regulation sensor histidine kinase GlnL